MCSFFLALVIGFVGPFLLALVSLGFRCSAGLLLISFGVLRPKFGLRFMLAVLGCAPTGAVGKLLGWDEATWPAMVQFQPCNDRRSSTP